MKIAISQLRPNLFRDTGLYPISREKVEALKASIRTTGFWDNMLARPGRTDLHQTYELAYGHHRLQALKELVDEKVIEPDFIIECPVRRIDDPSMLRIMLQENPDARAGAIVTLEFLSKETRTPRRDITASDICQFIGGVWYGNKMEVKVRKVLKEFNFSK